MNQLIKKALSITLLASLANTIEGDDILGGENTYANVLNRWTINLPAVTYDEPTNVFTMTFSNTNTDGSTNTNGNGDNSRSMGIPFGGNGEGGGSPYQINGPGDFLPNFSFEIDKSEIATNPLIYAFVTPALQSEPANEYDPEDIGFGIMRMMVRSSLGFEDQPTGGYYEVNFIETIIKLKYKLTAGVFTLAKIQVKPRIQRSGEEIPLVAEAYYCNPDDIESRTNPTRERPREITTYGPPPIGSESINQGQLLTICISPDDQTYSDGYYLKKIKNFDWNHMVDTTVEQEAIENNEPSTNALTLYSPVNCDGEEWCYFQTMLKAPFYYTPGAVKGSGEVLFQYGPNDDDRRLEATEVDEILRRLQDNAGSPANVNVGIFVGGNDQGPGALRTSGGSSFGIYTVTVMTGILVAHLLKYT